MGRPGDLVRAWDLGAGDFPRALCSTQAGAGRRGAAAAEARIAGVGQGVNEQPCARKRIRTRAGCAGATRGISYGDFPREELRGGIGGPVTALTLPRSGNFSKIWAGLNSRTSTGNIALGSWSRKKQNTKYDAVRRVARRAVHARQPRIHERSAPPRPRRHAPPACAEATPPSASTLSQHTPADKPPDNPPPPCHPLTFAQGPGGRGVSHPPPGAMPCTRHNVIARLLARSRLDA